MKKPIDSHIDECLDKIERLLSEYNCKLEIDLELSGNCILVDQDTLDFLVIAEASK